MSKPSPIGPDQVGQTSLIIAGALIMGLVMFGAVAVVLRLGQSAELGLLSYLGTGLAVLMIFARLTLPAAMAAGQIRRIAAQPPADWRASLAGVYQSTVIVGNALLEGAGMFNLIAYFLHGHWLSLAVVGSLISLMAMTVPSQQQFEAWAAQVQRDHS